MSGYTTADVAELLSLSQEKIRLIARAGLLVAVKDTRGHYRYTFQDIVLLRTAKELFAARVPPKRIWRALRLLRKQLPSGQPLTAVRISAQGDEVVVRDKHVSWHAETGQASFDFFVSDLASEVRPLVKRVVQAAHHQTRLTSDDWYNLALDCEIVGSLQEAKRAYTQALTMDAGNADAHINMGRLFHAENDLKSAEKHYRAAVDAARDNPMGPFNLGVVLEDAGEQGSAIIAYEQAIEIDPEFADAHYNLAQVYEQCGDRTAALRHLARYKALTQPEEA